ncbi:hypothetical protein PT974_09891 [Cladobotryum mycophilum]|uniref:Insecticidal crystal toxin domain-containing protein n=1 Tax=Cladobotryum mycophilum TaxID=491253 RepID=A0ABR0SIE7_9HYPO
MALDFHGPAIANGNMPVGSIGMRASHADKVVFHRRGPEPFHFDDSKLGTVVPVLGEIEGYNVNITNLHDIFGINATNFGKVPKRMVVPALKGRHTVENWYETSGYLYVVEPEAWIPEILLLNNLPASKFITQHEKESETITETKFNAGTSAELTISARASYFGVTAEAKSHSSMSFQYTKSTTTKETLKTTGKTGDQPVYQLALYPLLKCKVIKRQRIEYTINDSSEEIKWGTHSYEKWFWDNHYVNPNRLDEVEKATLHPVPMEGNGLGNKAYMLPVPQLTKSGELDVLTLLTRTGWKGWYRYDAHEWENVNMEITVAAPDNHVAFRPAMTWTTLPPLSPS